MKSLYRALWQRFEFLRQVTPTSALRERKTLPQNAASCLSAT